jgi:transcriptional regulator with XRE-family HTH domain
LQESDEELLKTLGNKLRDARERQKLAQSHVAKKIGKSVATLSQIESGKNPGVGLLTIIEIIRALEVDPIPLLGSIGLLLEWQRKRSSIQNDPATSGAVSALNKLFTNMLRVT